MGKGSDPERWNFSSHGGLLKHVKNDLEITSLKSWRNMVALIDRRCCDRGHTLGQEEDIGEIGTRDLYLLYPLHTQCLEPDNPLRLFRITQAPLNPVPENSVWIQEGTEETSQQEAVESH